MAWKPQGGGPWGGGGGQGGSEYWLNASYDGDDARRNTIFNWPEYEPEVATV